MGYIGLRLTDCTTDHLHKIALVNPNMRSSKGAIQAEYLTDGGGVVGAGEGGGV